MTARHASDAAAILAADDLYRDTIDLTPQMPWTADADGRLVAISRRWNKVTGQSAAAALGAGWIDRLHDEDRAHVRSALGYSVETGEPLFAKSRLAGVAGDLRWVRISAFPKRDDDGRVVRWHGLIEDIDDQERALVALRESEEHYHYTLALNPQIPWTADPEGRILESGPRWLELVGIQADRWTEALHPDDVVPTMSAWTHSLRTGDRVDVRYRLRQADGVYRWFRARAGARRGTTGEILRWYGMLEDIDEQVAIEETLRDREAWIRQAHEAAGIGLFEVDFDSGCAKLSIQSLLLHGLPADADPIFPGTSWNDLVRPEDGPGAWAAIERSVATGETYDYTFGVPLADGGLRWLTGLGRIEYHADGRPCRLLGINIDVTARRAVEAALEESEALNRSIVNASPDGIKLISTTGEILFANPKSRRGLELDEDVELVGRDWISLWPAAAQGLARAAIGKAAAGDIGRFVAPRALPHGRQKYWDVLVAPVLSDDGMILRLVTIARDITEQKAAEDRIQWNATHDPLTGLPNRRLLDDRLAAGIAAAEASGEGLAVFIVDLDRFKQINDTLGHDAGDAVLRAFADRLRNSFRADDTVARFGGDEFAIILPGICDEAQVAAVGDGMLARLREPITYAGASLDCGASIGASLYPAHGGRPSDLLKRADIALYSSKSKRSGEFLIFAPQMQTELQQRISMTNLARDALQNRRLMPFYQPKVDLRSGRIAGFEALARWADFHGRIHLPGSIAAAFDDWDVSTAITARMLEQVVGQMRAWQDAGVHYGHVALNASAADFLRPDFGDMVLAQLRDAGVPTRCLQIEVTESVFLARATDIAEATLGQLSRAGVAIALDDFGTGYASLSHLNRFPVDVIKIDQSFVSGLGDTRGAAAIVEAVLSLGRNLGLEVVAEGIETTPQARRLADLGCPCGQGFLFSEAVPAADVPAVAATIFAV